MIGIALGKFIKDSLFQIIASTAIVGVLVVSCMARDAKIENRGAEKQTAKIEKANRNATQIGGRAAAGTTDNRVRGQRDPTTRND